MFSHPAHENLLDQSTRVQVDIFIEKYHFQIPTTIFHDFKMSQLDDLELFNLKETNMDS
jgi:hypothetical protein